MEKKMSCEITIKMFEIWKSSNKEHAATFFGGYCKQLI